MNLDLLLRLLNVVGSATANLPGFVAIYDEARGLLEPTDQATAKEALADVQADNDEGHLRLQAKLAAAARR